MVTELSQPTKVVVTDADDMADMFHGQLRVQQQSQMADNVDRFHYHGTNGEGVVVTGKSLEDEAFACQTRLAPC